MGFFFKEQKTLFSHWLLPCSSVLYNNTFHETRNWIQNPSPQEGIHLYIDGQWDRACLNNWKRGKKQCVVSPIIFIVFSEVFGGRHFQTETINLEFVGWLSDNWKKAVHKGLCMYQDTDHIRTEHQTLCIATQVFDFSIYGLQKFAVIFTT